MQVFRVFVLLGLSSAAFGLQGRGSPADDPFAFFRPLFTISASERQAIDRGQSIVRLLPSRDRQVAVFTAVPVDAGPDRLIAWMRDIVALKKSPVVLAIGRLSENPRVEELAGLTLDEGDLQSIRTCKPADCDVKLTADEIRDLQTSLGHGKPLARAAFQQEFRALMLRRVQEYDARAPAPPIAGLWDPASVSEVDSFSYWSKEQFSGKPVVSATHVRILRALDPALPEIIVAEEQIFATHYINESSSLTAMLRGHAGATRYLAYFNRSQIDVLGGFFGGLVRVGIEHRLKGQAPAILREVRRRLESGAPAPEPLARDR